MARSKTELKTFNRGLISPLALARTDLERTALSAETMTNWMPRRLGSMMLRPGTQYIGATASNNTARIIPFVYSTSDTALIEITDTMVRVWVDDSLVTRETVSTAITNGDFDAALGAEWTDDDQAGATSDRVAGGGGTSFLRLLGTGSAEARRTQEVTVAAMDQGTEHALTIHVGEDSATGVSYSAFPVTLRVGSTSGGDDYIAETSLDNGYHSLSFTPTGNFFVQFANSKKGYAFVEDVNISAAGTMTVTSPWAEADLSKLRYDQSADVVYVACDGYQQYKIERRSTTSWSVVRYQPLDGPFGDINTSAITLTPSALTSTANLTASVPLWKSTDKGSLVKVGSNGQTVSQSSVVAENTFTGDIRVTGVSNQRVFTYTVSGRSDSTITLQRSLSDPDISANWVDVVSITTNGTVSYDDTLDNQIAWYRIGIKTGDYGTDTVSFSLDYPTGSIEGIGIISSVTSNLVATVWILQDFGGTTATANWYLGGWSSAIGYPTTVGLVEGRLSWAGRSKVWLSVSDAYESFDDEVEGDSGPIRRTIGSGAVDTIQWMLPLRQLLLGSDSREYSLRSTGDEDILTPTNANPKVIGTQGATNSQAIITDQIGLYVQRGGQRLFQLGYNDTFSYSASDLTLLYPEAGDGQIVHLTAQQQPDTRIHCVKGDGTVSLLVHDPAENVTCWVKVEMGASTLANYEYSSKIADLSAQSLGGKRIQFNNDGTVLIWLAVDGASNEHLYKYTLSTAYDISTAAFVGDVDISSSLDGIGVELFIDPDGLRAYVSTSNDIIHQFAMSSPYEVNTISYTGKSTDVSSTLTDPWGLFFRADGKTLFVHEGNNATENVVHQFSLGTAWDITTVSYDDISVDISDQGIWATQGSLYFNDAGTLMYASTNTNDTLYVYRLSTAWDLTTLSYSGSSYDYSAQNGLVTGIAYSADENDFYILGNDEVVYQYTKNNAVLIEDACVMPGADGDGEDAVYYSVRRRINSTTVRYLEKWALESECVGGTTNKNLDSHVTGTVVNGVLTGLSHLEGEEVYVWVNGVDAGAYVVADGQISGVTTDGSAVAGVKYTAQFKSSKLGYLTEKKNVIRLGVIMRNTHYQGLKYGPDFDTLDDLPLSEDGAITADDTVHVSYDEESFSFDGHWDTDSRVCLQAESPRPVTLTAAIVETED